MFFKLGNTPTFSNLGQTVTFPDSTAANTLMYTVSASDNDPLDTLTVAMTTTTSSFSFDAISGNVLLLNQLNQAHKQIKQLKKKIYCNKII